MHGINLINKEPPLYVAQFKAQDAQFLASEGFTSVRLGFAWSRVEPQPGHYDDSYIRKLVALNDLLARYGIRTLLDVHIDAYNDFVPAWAGGTGKNIGDNPNSDAGYKALWDDDPAPDGVGLQTHFVRMWGRVAAFFANNPNVLGYDPINEPQPGNRYEQCTAGIGMPCQAFDSGQLAFFYTRVIAAIRASGDHHIIWPEPFPSNGGQNYLPKFDDPQVGVDFHLYCIPFGFILAGTTNQPDLTDPAAQAACAQSEKNGLQTQLSYAKGIDRPILDGEFSASDQRMDNRRMVALFDQSFVSRNIWDYYNSDNSGTTNFQGEGLLIDPSKPGSEANAKQAKLDDIVTPYAQAIAGTPKSYSFDRSTHTMSLSYSTKAAGPVPLASCALTQIFVPKRQYPTGYTVQAHGARVLSAPTSEWVELLADHGADQVSVTITPRAGSTTERPIINDARSRPTAPTTSACQANAR